MRDWESEVVVLWFAFLLFERMSLAFGEKCLVLWENDIAYRGNYCFGTAGSKEVEFCYLRLCHFLLTGLLEGKTSLNDT